MRYIWKDYRYFMKHERFVCVLAIVCILVSTLVLHFAYGLYQNRNCNYENEPNMAQAGESEETVIRFFFSDDPDKRVTKKEVQECLQEVAAKMPQYEEYGNSDFVLFTCFTDDLAFNKIFPQDRESVLRVIVDEDGLEAPRLLFDNMIKSGMARGQFWTNANERIDGEKVCVFPEYKSGQNTTVTYIDDKGKEYPSWDHALNADGTTTVNGEDYKVIGYYDWDFLPWVPFGSLADDIVIKRGEFCFIESVTGRTRDDIVDIVKKQLGDKVTVDENSLRYRKDVKYKYKTVLLLVAVMSALVAVNYMILYMYLLERRKRESIIFRMCGMPRWKCVCMNVVECILFTIPFYMIAAVAYALWILPLIRRFFLRMSMAYSLWIYAALFGIYLAASLIVCTIGVFVNSRGSIVNGLQ